MGKSHGKGVGQVVLRWLYQRGTVTLAKSVHKARMAENINIFDFELTDTAMNEIATLDMKQSVFFDHCDPNVIVCLGDGIPEKDEN
ncbi:aldo/keto reductase [Pediococcus ethanolidurans]|uniref:aldo/keto reductase n=1 Tax=Pediococcus ethanolidurans TaxID=319653 RepID=UPI002955482C|nr:aldo/keto reductase [Pediococcus ethanolidurans]